MGCDSVTQTVVSEYDPAPGDLGIRIDREKAEEGRIWIRSKN
jgi:hypothetical protein